MNWNEIVGGLLRALFPPFLATPTQLFWHRNYISTGIVLMAVGGALHIALVCGFVTSVFPGFAKADDVSRLQILMQQQLLNTMEKDIFDTRQQQCHTNDPVAKTLFLQRLNEKLGQYGAASGGKQPRVPECWEFGQTVAAASGAPR